MKLNPFAEALKAYIEMIESDATDGLIYASRDVEQHLFAILAVSKLTVVECHHLARELFNAIGEPP